MTRLRESAAFQGTGQHGPYRVYDRRCRAGRRCCDGSHHKGDAGESTLSLEQLLGSKKKAVETQNWIVEQAAKTPFSLTDLSGATQKLLGFGFELDDVKEKLLVIGDVAAGTGAGAEGSTRSPARWVRCRLKQKITGEEMMQLTEAGIPAWKILAKEMGMSTKELMEMASSRGGGALLFDQGGLDKLFGGLDKQYGGLMKKQARTLAAAGQRSLTRCEPSCRNCSTAKSGKASRCC